MTVMKHKKRKSSAKDSWSFDGGINYDSEQKTARNYSTQNRDERQRRGKAKSALHLRHQNFIKKMGNKVRFGESVNEFEEKPTLIPSTAESITPSAQHNTVIQSQPQLYEKFIKKFNILELKGVNGTKRKSVDCIDKTEIVCETCSDDKSSGLVFSSKFSLNSYNIEPPLTSPSLEIFEWFFQSEINDNPDVAQSLIAQSKYPMSFVDKIKLNSLYSIFSSLNKKLPSFPNLIDSLLQIPGICEYWRRDIPLNEFCQKLFPFLSSYCDVLVDGRELLNDSVILEAAIMHSIFHITKSREFQIQHNLILKEESINDREFRDQGFTRPRLLILCPFRSSVNKIIQTIVSICGENTSISGMEKFQAEYINGDAEESSSKKEKPLDWHAIFEGNIDDDFKIGVQCNPGDGRGQGSSKGFHLRLFSEFYQSDIIIASPIGLKLLIDSGDKVSFDYLSSIEQVIVYKADVLYMQNWEHVEFVMKRVNCVPKETNDTDFTRVRPYFLNGLAAFHRQLIVISHFSNPEIQSFFRTFGSSKSGQIRIKREWQEGTIMDVVAPVKQVFQAIPDSTLSHLQEEARFKYFVENVLSSIIAQKQSHTLIVAPSYFDYVRIRNELLKVEASAVFICEYSRDSEISRGRAHFFHGQKNLMLYSGRAHFFWRYKMRGVKNVIFYSLPEYPHFYSEMMNMIDLDEGAGLTLYSKLDKMALERVMGKQRCAQILDSKKSSFVFF